MDIESAKTLRDQILDPKHIVNEEQESIKEQNSEIMNTNLAEQEKTDVKEQDKKEERHQEQVIRPDVEDILNRRSGIHFAQDIKAPSELFKKGKQVIPEASKQNDMGKVEFGQEDKEDVKPVELKPVGRFELDYTKSLIFRKEAKRVVKGRHSVY